MQRTKKAAEEQEEDGRGVHVLENDEECDEKEEKGVKEGDGWEVSRKAAEEQEEGGRFDYIK